MKKKTRHCILVIFMLLYLALMGNVVLPDQEFLDAVDLADYYGINIVGIRGILPDWIPTTDQFLFEAYLNLFRHTEPIFYGLNGMHRTSGRDLGFFIANKRISIQWEAKSIVDCGANGKACVDRMNSDSGVASTIFLVKLGYTPTNIDDIYAGRIAHEAFHLTFPYGNVNSKLEERDANRIGSIIIGSIIIGSNASEDFRVPDYRPTALDDWAVDCCANVYGACSYENLPTYPNAVWKSIFTARGKK